MPRLNVLKPARESIYSVRCLSTINYYKILGLKEDATQEQIKAAYKEHSKKLHPDINRDDPNTHEKFIQLKEAYSVLSSPKHKRDYDNNQAIRNSMFRARTTSTHSKVSEHGTLRYTYGGPSPMDTYSHKFGSKTNYRPSDVSDGIPMGKVILGLLFTLFAFEGCILTYYHFTDDGHRKTLREFHRDVTKERNNSS